MKIKLAYLPERPAKPRSHGLTVINDYGLSMKNIEDILSASGHIIDMVRISPDVLSSAEGLSERVKIYKQAGITPFMGGIMFEASYIRDSINEYMDLLEANHFEYMEVSDGIVEITPNDKAVIIHDLSKRFKVVSKVGAKHKKAFFRKEYWKDYIMAETKAGSHKIIIEGGEAGTSPVISGKIEMKLNLVNYILSIIDNDKIIWEAPQEEQQIWFITRFGANVNLAEINPVDVPGLESKRLGLHWETFLNNIPETLKRSRSRKTDPMRDIDFQI